MGASTKVKTGLDVLKERDFMALKGRKVGLLANHASVDRNMIHVADLLHEQKGFELVCIFGPQHGFHGTTQDNMVEWQGFFDERLGIPVYSLYGEVRQPTREMLEGLDLLVIDLFDVGSRYYTFLWTATLCLEVCASFGIPVLVLDRPNPLGGLQVEGPLLQREFTSFVGRFPIPIRHGMTMGELLAMFNVEEEIECRLEIVKIEGWKREEFFDGTDLPWIMPSPNMPTLETALVYPGFCLLEGTNLSEGRGTTRPFEIFGAPFIDPYRLVTELAREKLPGVFIRPIFFEPAFQKHAGCQCGGAQVHVISRDHFRPVLTAVAVLKTVFRLYPDHFRWREPPYEYEEHHLPIDILAGSNTLRMQIEKQISLEEIREACRCEEEAFLSRRRKYLFYT